MTLRKISFALLLLFASSCVVFAQSSMTDEQILEYVLKAKESGKSNEAIASELIKKGVSVQKITALQQQYANGKNNGGMGGKGSYIESRLRTSIDPEGKNGTLGANGVIPGNGGFNEYGMFDENFLYDYLLLEEKNKEKNRIFGHNIFNQEELSFEPNINIATPEDYRLGAGDEVYIDIWGASQITFSSTISPDGNVDVEGYGPIYVSGLTVAEANNRLRNTLGSRYANSKVRLTVGQTRTISINVMGEVAAPGTYTVSPFATAFHALYMAGGVNNIGTLRDIQVWRKGKKVSSIDLYDYILNGKLKGNVRLMDDDIIIVGTYDCLVDIRGKVKRPMFYEMKPTESVATLIKYAGGFTGDAYKENVRLIRKSEGQMAIYNLDEIERTNFKVNDADSLYVDSVLNRFRNMVEVKGAVFRPGMFQMDGNIGTVRQLVEAAGGVTEEAFTNRAILHRRKEDYSLEVVPVDLKGLLAHRIADIPLRNEDVLFIPSNKEANEEKTVSIYGEVRNGGVYPFAENTTLEDLILQAGGLKDAASMARVDISRISRDNKTLTTSNATCQTFNFAIKEGFVIEGEPGFILVPFDQVFIRRSPGYVLQYHASAEGEVNFPGTITISKKIFRLSDLVRGAGNVTDEAYIRGARLERKLTDEEMERRREMTKILTNADTVGLGKITKLDKKVIAINLEKALENPGSDWDVVIQAGDQLSIPRYDNTITISGGVMYPNACTYKEGENLKYYINQAGGYAKEARKRHVFAVNMNGTVQRIKKRTEIQPGCEIFVPLKSERNRMSVMEVMSMGSMVTTMAAVLANIVK